MKSEHSAYQIKVNSSSVITGDGLTYKQNPEHIDFIGL